MAEYGTSAGAGFGGDGAGMSRMVEAVPERKLWPAGTIDKFDLIQTLGRHPARRIVLMFVLGAWFFTVFPTEPLYFENQNTKFLHGLAAVGLGQLDRDWTANTTDVMPVFTGIVYLLHAYLPAWTSYLVQIALFAVFLYSIVRLAVFAAGPAARRPIFSMLVGVIVVASQFANGGARVWGGVAKQYLLGPALEPQSFGVLFLLAMILFLGRRRETALLLAAVPAVIHPGYVVPAGALILAFVLAAHRDPDRDGRPRYWVVATSLAATAASMVYLGIMIFPSDQASWQAANQILAQVRIPRHAVPAYWFDVDAGAKLVACGLALWLTRRSGGGLFWIVAVCFGLAVGLTLLSLVIASNELGMISPWRISVYLVPLCLAVLVGHLLAHALDLFERSGDRRRAVLKGLAWALAAVAIVVTLRGVVEKIERYRPVPLPDYIVHMRRDDAPDALYLSDPYDMNIRLQSQRPQLVSWKSHPYRDVEVLAWYRRFRLAERVFSDPASIDCRALGEAIDRYRTTRLLVEDPTRTVACERATLTFRGERARIFELGR